MEITTHLTVNGLHDHTRRILQLVVDDSEMKKPMASLREEIIAKLDAVIAQADAVLPQSLDDYVDKAIGSMPESFVKNRYIEVPESIDLSEIPTGWFPVLKSVPGNEGWYHRLFLGCEKCDWHTEILATNRMTSRPSYRSQNDVIQEEVYNRYAEHMEAGCPGLAEGAGQERESGVVSEEA
jgi:hypothetical protein